MVTLIEHLVFLYYQKQHTLLIIQHVAFMVVLDYLLLVMLLMLFLVVLKMYAMLQYRLGSQIYVIM